MLLCSHCCKRHQARYRRGCKKRKRGRPSFKASSHLFLSLPEEPLLGTNSSGKASMSESCSRRSRGSWARRTERFIFKLGSSQRIQDRYRLLSMVALQHCRYRLAIRVTQIGLYTRRNESLRYRGTSNLVKRSPIRCGWKSPTM